MKIRYTKRKVRINLILGLAWLAVFIAFIIIDDAKSSWIKHGWLLLGFLNIGMFAYQNHYQYLTLENGVLKQNDLFFGKKITLSEIKQIRTFAGDYILKGENKELTINTQIVDPDSLSELVAELEKLDVEWN